MEFEGFESSNPSTDMNCTDIKDISFFEEDLDYESFGPMFNISDYLSVDIIEDQYKDHNTITPWLDQSSMYNCIKNSGSRENLDAANNNIDKTLAAIKSISQTPVIPLPTFVKAKPPKASATSLVPTTQSQAGKFTYKATQVTDIQPWASLNSSNTMEEAFEPMLNISEYVTVDIKEDQHNDLNTADNNSSVNSCSQYNGDSESLDAVNNNINKSTAPITSSSRIPVIPLPIFVKAKPCKISTTSLVQTTQSKSAKCTYRPTQATDIHPRESLNSSKSMKQSFGPMINLSEYLTVDIKEGQHRDLDKVDSEINKFSRNNCSKYDGNSEKLDVANNNGNKAKAPKTLSSRIQIDSLPIFVKAKPQKTATAALVQTTQLQSGKCAYSATQVTDIHQQSSLTSSNIMKHQNSYISAQPDSHTLSVKSLANLSNKKYKESRITTSASVKNVKAPDLPTTEHITPAVQSDTYMKSDTTDKDKKQGEKFYPRPPYSFTQLIALALMHSKTGGLPVPEIYSFICKYFPYYRTAPNGWKNSVRNNLSQTKFFEKMPDKPSKNPGKGYKWMINPSKLEKIDEDIQKLNKKDWVGIKDSLEYTEYSKFLTGEILFEPPDSMTSSSEDECDETRDSLFISIRDQTKKFMKYLIESPNFSINLNDAADILKIQKESLENISSILEGAGLIYRPNDNYINWSVDSCIEYLAAKEYELDESITSVLSELMKLKDDKDLAYVTIKDLDMTYSDKIVMALKIPPNSTMKVPEEITKKNLKLYFQSKDGPIQLFIDGICPF